VTGLGGLKENGRDQKGGAGVRIGMMKALQDGRKERGRGHTEGKNSKEQTPPEKAKKKGGGSIGEEGANKASDGASKAKAGKGEGY